MFCSKDEESAAMRDSEYFINEYFRLFYSPALRRGKISIIINSVKEMPSGHNWEDYDYPEYGSTKQICTKCFQVIKLRISNYNIGSSDTRRDLYWGHLSVLIPCQEMVMKRALE